MFDVLLSGVLVATGHGSPVVARDGAAHDVYGARRLRVTTDGKIEPHAPAAGERLEVRVDGMVSSVRWGTPDVQFSEKSGPPEPRRAWRMDSWKVEHGLPENDIRTLAETSDGYLWIGTPSGLARFDGVRFVAFDSRNTPALASISDDIRILRTGSDGELWIGARQGIAKFHRGQWHEVAKEMLDEPVRVRDLCVGRSGRIWAATDLGVRWVEDGKLVSKGLPGRYAVSTHGAFTVMESRDGLVWASFAEGLLRWHPERDETPTRMWGPSAGESLVCTLVETPDGTVWATSPGAVRGFRGNECLEHFPEEKDFAGAAFRPQRFCQDPVGNQYALSGPESVLCRIRGSSLVPETTDTGELLDRGQAVLADTQGNLWCGTDGRGLLRLSRRRIRSLVMEQPSLHTAAASVIEGPGGEVWMGSHHGMTIWERDGVTLLDFVVPPTWGSKTYSVSVLPESDEVWASFASFGAMELGRAVGQAVLEPNSRAPRLLSDVGGIRAQAWSDPETLWLGTTNALYRTRKSGERTRFPPFPSNDDIDVRTLLLARNGVLWLGSKGKGLARLMAPGSASPDQPFERWTTSDGLPGGSVWSLHEDSEGGLWVGTDHGLARMSGGQIRVVKAGGPIENRAIHAILEDGSGHMWFGHARGLCRARTSELKACAEGNPGEARWWTFDESDGMPDANVPGEYQSVSCRSRDGRLYFATGRGLAVVDPSDPTLELPPPRVYLESVVADGVTLASDGDPVPPRRSGPFSAIGRLGVSRHGDEVPASLPPDSARELRIRYTATSPTAPERLRFEYRLEGLDHDWRPGGIERVARYTNLKPGAYRFRVRATNHQGTRSIGEASWSFLLHPAFWQTAYFWLALTVALVALVTTFVRWRLSWQRRVLTLERQVALELERKRIARDLHDDLGAQLSVLALELGDATHETTLRTSDVKNRVRDVVRRLNSLIWSVDSPDVTLHALGDFVANLAHDLLGKTGIQLSLDFPETPSWRDPLDREVRLQLGAVASEALRNVVDHAEARTVRLRLAEDAEEVVLEIADDGRGFDPAGTRDDRGLANLRERIAEIGGVLDLHSIPGRGTLVRARAPRRKATASCPTPPA